MTRYDDDLRLAHILADSVDGLTMKRFKSQDLTVETKPDLTPVTDADREAEQVIRSQLGRVRNRDAVIGEEFGTTGSGSRQWVVDPIDGTVNYLYDLSAIEKNHETYANLGTVAASSAVSRELRSNLPPMRAVALAEA